MLTLFDTEAVQYEAEKARMRSTTALLGDNETSGVSFFKTFECEVAV